MPLDYADFAHYYEGHSLSDQQSRAHFTAFADLMECVARLFWDEGAIGDRLGITLDGDTIAALGAVESPEPLAISFNSAAASDPAGKKEP